MRATDGREVLHRTAPSPANRVEGDLDIAYTELLGTANGAEVLDGLGSALAQGEKDLIGHNPLAGNVPRLGALLAPRGELAGNRQLTARAGVNALDALEG